MARQRRGLALELAPLSPFVSFRRSLVNPRRKPPCYLHRNLEKKKAFQEEIEEEDNISRHVSLRTVEVDRVELKKKKEKEQGRSQQGKGPNRQAQQEQAPA